MVLCTDCANLSARAVDREMRPCHQIAVGGLAPRVIRGRLPVMCASVSLGVAGCGAASMDRMLGCGVCVHAVRRWTGGLCL